MNDIIQYASLDDPQGAIDALSWPDSTSLMYLEKVITGWLSSNVEQAPQLRAFKPDTTFKAWERGRIFCPEFELRWEKMADTFRLVYVGQALSLDGFTPANNLLDLAQTETEETTYYLWGRRVAEDDLPKIGVEGEPEKTGVFIQMQISAHLYYPIQHKKTNRLKLKVCHYKHKETGQLLYHRYQSLEEEL